MDIAPLKATWWSYLVSTPLGTLSNIPGLIFVVAQVIFSPLSWGKGTATKRNMLLPHCETARKGGKNYNHSLLLYEAEVKE